jgi:hypothetical protein
MELANEMTIVPTSKPKSIPPAIVMIKAPGSESAVTRIYMPIYTAIVRSWLFE